jgi:hypothetical protein
MEHQALGSGWEFAVRDAICDGGAKQELASGACEPSKEKTNGSEEKSKEKSNEEVAA